MKNRLEAIESCKNPLIAKWVYDLYMDAIEKESRTMFTYKKALESIIACEEIIKSGRDAMRLPGIGEYTAGKIDRKIAEHVKKGGEWHTAAKISEEIEATTVEITKKTSKQKKSSGLPPTYTPAFRSAPFAMLLVLYEEGGRLNRETLAEKGQKYCCSPIEPLLQSAISTLAGKGLTEKFGNLIDLTAEGKELAKRLYSTINYQLNPVAEDSEESSEKEEHGFDKRSFETFTWPSGTFDIELVMDLREVKSRDKREYFLDKLTSCGVRCSQRALPIGDFLWIAKRKIRGSDDEVVLDSIIERKTDSDLCSSIPDGRFKEQKHRLGGCGVKRVIYLLEDHGASSKVHAIGEEKVFAAIIQTQVVDKFFLRITHSMEETVAFICKLHLDICKRFQNKSLRVIASKGTFSHQEIKEKLSNEKGNYDGLGMGLFTWMNSKSGNMTVRDVFTKQLMTIKGVSREKAVKLASRYDTLPQLVTQISNEDGIKELADMTIGQRKLGNVLARRVHEVVHLQEYPAACDKGM